MTRPKTPETPLPRTLRPDPVQAPPLAALPGSRDTAALTRALARLLVSLALRDMGLATDGRPGKPAG